MLITTANDLPGYEVTETLGEVFGLTVRSRNIGSQIGAGLKSIMGGELKGMTKALVDSRQQVIDRMVEEAAAKGADAIVAMRFDTSEMGGNWTDLCLRHRCSRAEGVIDPSRPDGPAARTAAMGRAGWRAELLWLTVSSQADAARRPSARRDDGRAVRRR
jgi:uncharacterized protein YbjQ (UPF0145 family)